MKLNSSLVNDIKKRAQKLVPYTNIEKTKKDLEKILKARYQKLEPSLVNIYKGIRKNAERYGVPMNTLEAKFHDSYEMTVNGLEKVGKMIPFFENNQKTARKPRKHATKKKARAKGQSKTAGSRA
ncbi:MAG: hypothetical protein HRU09_13730 [Oligoflexales bacterium]|nr:hypothetical protein [Oligoflexales bacterium]